MAKYGRLTDPDRPWVTLGDVVKKYRLHVAPHKAASTQKSEAGQLTRLACAFGHILPDDVTQRLTYQYLDERSAFPTAARHDVTLLGHVFMKAIRWGRQPRTRRTVLRSLSPSLVTGTDEEFWEFARWPFRR